MNCLLFVYGSLRKGGEFHNYLNGADFIDSDILKGFIMTESGDYPVIWKSESPEDTVYVEIYRISDYHLTQIDILEGYSGPGMNNEYERITAFSSKGYQGFVYCNSSSTGLSMGDRIISGDWFKQN